MSVKTESVQYIPDYETFDYSTVWARRGIEDLAEKSVVSRWATGETGIELGGGFGRVTSVIERRIPTMFMLDYSLRNLRRAASTLGNTTLVRGSVSKLPFEDSVFDFVALVRVIHHVPDARALLDEVVRVSRNGGTFVLGIANHLLKRGSEKNASFRLTPDGYRIYPTHLVRFVHPRLERAEILGVGAFDNRIGRKLERLWPLATIDYKTSRLWPAKAMLFVRYRVRKEEGETNEPRVVCRCGGMIVGNRCETCGRSYGEIIDLVES